MRSKKIISVGIAAVMSLAIAMPVFAQGNENRDYQAIQDERDQRKQRDLLEGFLKNYPNSAHRPDFDIQLITLYYGNKDWAQMIKLADNFVQQQGTADAKSKSNFFTLAMEGARQLGNTNKFNEYADRALTADPNNMSVLMTLSRNLSENPPADGAARTAALDKALGYAQKAQKAPKPDKMTDAEWQSTQNRVHGILGVIYFNQGKWEESANELAEYLKTNPTDGVNQYRYGAAMFSQVQATLSNLQALNNDAQLAQKAERDLGPYIDRMNARTKEFEAQRDITIDAMAKKNTVLIAVRDHGPGMTQQFVNEELFRPLKSTKRGGFGIGGYQVRELMRDLGGDVTVESKVGEGTCVTLSLPLVQK